MATSIRDQRNDYVLRYPIQLGDNTTLSIQASAFHYCNPRNSETFEYEEWEIGFPDKVIQELIPYAEDPDNLTETIYTRVPTDLIVEIINSRDGVLKILMD